MARFGAEAILPTLLERLIDERPESEMDGSGGWGLDGQAYRDAVLRDVERLLNATPPPGRPSRASERGAVAMKPGETRSRRIHEWVGGSSVYYGIDLPVGGMVTEELVAELTENLQAALERFEPRLRRVRVTAEPASAVDGGGRRRWLPVFLVEGELYAEPVPEELRLRTELDVISGRASASEWTPSVEPGNPDAGRSRMLA